MISTLPCPACAARRLHTPADWPHHPYARHGYDGARWTHPDLDPICSVSLQVLAGAAPSQRQISGEVVEAPAAPAGEDALR